MWEQTFEKNVEFNSTMSATDDEKDVLKEVLDIFQSVKLFFQFHDYEFK